MCWYVGIYVSTNTFLSIKDYSRLFPAVPYHARSRVPSLSQGHVPYPLHPDHVSQLFHPTGPDRGVFRPPHTVPRRRRNRL